MAYRWVGARLQYLHCERNGDTAVLYWAIDIHTQVAKFMWTTWGSPGSCRPQVGPMLAHEPCYEGGDRHFVSVSTWYPVISATPAPPTPRPPGTGNNPGTGGTGGNKPGGGTPHVYGYPLFPFLPYMSAAGGSRSAAKQSLSTSNSAGQYQGKSQFYQSNALAPTPTYVQNNNVVRPSPKQPMSPANFLSQLNLLPQRSPSPEVHRFSFPASVNNQPSVDRASPVKSHKMSIKKKNADFLRKQMIDMMQKMMATLMAAGRKK